MAEFKSIKDTVWKRLHDWETNFLSQAGKENLLFFLISNNSLIESVRHPSVHWTYTKGNT